MSDNSKWIKGFEGKYKVFDDGRIQSFQNRLPRFLTVHDNTAGYLTVCLCKGNKKKTFPVHKLVADAFVPGYKEGLQVNHIDFNKKNNCATNLEWVTRSENNNHARKFGAYKTAGKPRVPVVGTNMVTGEIITFPSISKAAAAIGGQISEISECCAGKAKYHHGYTWRRAS